MFGLFTKPAPVSRNLETEVEFTDADPKTPEDWTRYVSGRGEIHPLDTKVADFTVTFDVCHRAAGILHVLESWLKWEDLYPEANFFVDTDFHIDETKQASSRFKRTFLFYHSPRKKVDRTVVERFAEVFGGTFSARGVA